MSPMQIRQSRRPGLSPMQSVRRPRGVVSSLSIFLRAMTEKEPLMNKYALLAKEHWATYAPTRYAALEDPTRFFEELGETAAAQIQQLTIALERDLPQEIPYLERVAQLRAVQKHAESTVMTELVFSVEPEATSLDEELEMVLAALPSAAMVTDELQAIRLQAEEDAEWEGSRSPVLTDEQNERVTRLEDLLPLVSSPMPAGESEIIARILALRKFLPAQ